MNKTADWHSLKLGFLAGVAVPELAERYGITESCLRKRISRQGWAHEKKQLTVAVTTQTMETCEGAAKRFRLEMISEFDAWFEMARRARAKIAEGDFESFNVVANAFVKLHAAAFRHHDVEKVRERLMICADDHTSRFEEVDEPAIDVESVEEATMNCTQLVE
ncbi:MAG TPA: hypothetical protein VGF13_21300 [Verrucomicrobiae bacterium]|jgi:hypothetical protein